MIGGFSTVTMKSVFSPLSFESIKDTFGSLFLIKERGGYESLKEMSAPSFSQVFKFHVNKFKQSCSVSNKGTILALLVVYTSLTYLWHFETCLFPDHHFQEKCLFYIDNNVLPVICTSERWHPQHAQDWPQFHSSWPRRKLWGLPSRQTPHTLPQLPSASCGTAKGKTTSCYTLNIFPNRLAAESVNIYWVCPTAWIIRFIEPQWMWKRWVGICGLFCPLVPEFRTTMGTSQWQAGNKEQIDSSRDA